MRQRLLISASALVVSLIAAPVLWSGTGSARAQTEVVSPPTASPAPTEISPPPTVPSLRPEEPECPDLGLAPELIPPPVGEVVPDLVLFKICLLPHGPELSPDGGTTLSSP